MTWYNYCSANCVKPRHSLIKVYWTLKVCEVSMCIKNSKDLIFKVSLFQWPSGIKFVFNFWKQLKSGEKMNWIVKYRFIIFIQSIQNISITCWFTGFLVHCIRIGIFKSFGMNFADIGTRQRIIIVISQPCSNCLYKL